MLDFYFFVHAGCESSAAIRGSFLPFARWLLFPTATAHLNGGADLFFPFLFSLPFFLGGGARQVRSANLTPHVTISTAKDVSADYSNELLFGLRDDQLTRSASLFANKQISRARTNEDQGKQQLRIKANSNFCFPLFSSHLPFFCFVLFCFAYKNATGQTNR